VGAATPTFSSPANFQPSHNEYSVAIGDIDGDGVPDLTAVSRDGTITFLRNLTAPGATAPTFANGLDYSAGNEPLAITVGDVNGDGLLDIALGDEGVGGVLLLNKTAPGSTTPSFQPQIQLKIGSSGEDALIGDLNGDGLPDIAVSSLGTANVYAFTSQFGGSPAVIQNAVGAATIVNPLVSPSGGGGGASSGGGSGGGTNTQTSTGAVDPGLLAAWLGLLLLGRIRASRHRGP
jgi:hypothetical protein